MKNVHISDEEKWQAVVSCNKDYDGLFFYGVKTTEIFCRPSCRAKTPARKNVVFSNTADKMIEAGFRPCKRCRPDRIVFEPDLEIAKKAEELFISNYDKPLNFNSVARELGVSLNHLIRLFRKYSGTTPVQYITKLRIDKAIEVFGQMDLNILEIAYMCGFKSISNFYKCFKEQTGHTPMEYRKRRSLYSFPAAVLSVQKAPLKGIAEDFVYKRNCFDLEKR